MEIRNEVSHDLWVALSLWWLLKLEFPGERTSPWNRGRFIVQLISFWRPSSSWHCAWCESQRAAKETERHVTHQKSMPSWFNPSKDGDLNSSLGTWDRLWRREYIKQSLEAWVGLSPRREETRGQSGRENRQSRSRKCKGPCILEGGPSILSFSRHVPRLYGVPSPLHLLGMSVTARALLSGSLQTTGDADTEQ